MNRCRECNSPMMPQEQMCFGCNTPVADKDTRQIAFGKKFAGLLKFAVYGSGALTVASLFLSSYGYTPSFIRCITVFLVLLLAKSSAEQMLERKG